MIVTHRVITLYVTRAELEENASFHSKTYHSRAGLQARRGCERAGLVAAAPGAISALVTWQNEGARVSMLVNIDVVDSGEDPIGTLPILRAR